MEPLLISVDVETAGPAPGRYPLLEIGACVVDRPDQTFSVRLIPDRDGVVPEALAVSGLPLEALRVDGTDPEAAMASFARWVDRAAGDRRIYALEEEVKKFLAADHPNYGKAAKRMYNIFRLDGRYHLAVFLRELFDEPTTVLYQVYSVVRTLEEASEPGSPR